ncbi:MAG: hypothetical protein ACRDNS_30735, partial [Trebonia sp.]
GMDEMADSTEPAGRRSQAESARTPAPVPERGREPTIIPIPKPAEEEPATRPSCSSDDRLGGPSS